MWFPNALFCFNECFKLRQVDYFFWSDSTPGAGLKGGPGVALSHMKFDWLTVAPPISDVVMTVRTLEMGFMPPLM